MKVTPGTKSNPVGRRFGSERDIASLTGFSHRTLQKDRLLGRKRFPFYKIGGKVLYDLAEIEALVRSTRSGA
jgi:hypothetical protein